MLDKAGIGGLAARFLKVVASNRRLFAARDMIRGFRTLVAHHKGETSATVTVAEQPTDAHLAAIKDALKAVTKKDVQVEVKVDPVDHRRADRQARQPHGRHVAPHQAQRHQAMR